ncbi:MAG: DNA primase [Oscillospiraceae bacterium]|nr:DNA primase [Oscillospiraceae bacterium]
MALPDEFFDQIRQANDIVTVMSGYARLKKAGRDYTCLCPFHSEKTPSCHVYTDSQSFYCFGCGLGGDVITFTRLTENLDYMGAVRLIAERSGIPVPEDGEDGEKAKAELRKRSRIYEMNKLAAKFFVNNLLSEEGKAGLAFLRERGLNDNTIRKYGLGYAADSWDSLKRHMNLHGYGDAEMIEASLLKQNERGNIYDMFRGRVMFPVIDRLKNIIAFSGRIVNDDGKSGKYVNSATTPVYTKGKHLFSINFAKNSKKDCVILCEGNMDAVTLNQAGFDNAVAILGTALTPEQVRNELRFYWEGKKAVIAYDCDKAGAKATEKTIGMLNQAGMSAKVLELRGAKDPDDYIKMFGAESFATLVDKSIPVISFKLNQFKENADTDTPEGRADYLRKAVEFLSEINNQYERRVYVSELAEDCKVSVDWIEEQIGAKRKSNRYFQQKDDRKALLKSTTKRDEINPDSNRFPAEVRAENGIIAFLFHSPDKLPLILRRLNPVDFPTVFNRKLFETLILRLTKRQSIDISSLGGEFSAEEVGRIKKVKIDNADLPFTDERLNDYINVLVELKQKANKKTSDEMTNEEALEYINKRVKRGG